MCVSWGSLVPRPSVLVGFSPRMVVWNIVDGAARYLHWQHTWWSGVYSVVLTKASVVHRDYLQEYTATVPLNFLKHVDAIRNCEDIAMAHVVASKVLSFGCLLYALLFFNVKLLLLLCTYEQAGAAPVWYQGIVYETSTGGIRISSGHSHFTRRGACIDMLTNATDTWPWITGHQKVVPVGIFDLVNQVYDLK